MFKWILHLQIITIVFCMDDGLAPNFVYLEPIEDFFVQEEIELQIIVTDRNEINQISLFYRFNEGADFIKREMQVGDQPVIYDVTIPLDEVTAGFIQYYFWAKDEYGNEATWPIGGEDLPIVLPVYNVKKEKDDFKLEISTLGKDYQAPENLEDNLPYYLEIGMLAPEFEVTFEEGVPIIVLSVYDAENIVNQETVNILIDGKRVSSFISTDMITYIPQNTFEPGYHIIRYEANNLSDELLVKEFSFFMNEQVLVVSEEKETWKEKINFKGNFGWNTDYDPSPRTPIDIHKVNTSAKFNLGQYKFNVSGLISANIYDEMAREEAKYRQPTSRLKFNMKSPYFDFNYGDNSPEFSEFSLKGTRVRGVFTKVKLGTWETSFVSGETKHWIDSDLSTNIISIWDPSIVYQTGDYVYDNGITWVSKLDGVYSEPCIFEEDTCRNNNDWEILEESNYSEISNDFCPVIQPEEYGLNPDSSIINLDGIDGQYYIWNGSSCEEIFIYSTKSMITGNDGLEIGSLHMSYDECRTSCMVPIQYTKGSPIRNLQGLRTSKDFFEHAKFGISVIRSYDVKDNDLIPYSVLDSYNYEGNFVASSDFKLHFNHDKTILSGEYGISVTFDQSKPDTLILKQLSNVTDPLYGYIDWNGVNCYMDGDSCIIIKQDGDSFEPQIVEGINESQWAQINNSKKEIDKYNNILGFNFNDDIMNYAEGRGISGLTPVEIGDLMEGQIDLLLKRPAFKLLFKTPIPLFFTEVNIQSELSQAPLNYISHGSSSIQTDVRNWKNKMRFKLMKNQIDFSLGYDDQIKSPWNPENEDEGEIKRAVTNTKTGTLGLNFRNYPGINYSLRLQDREDLSVRYLDGAINDSTTGLKQMSTHTLGLNYKLKIKKININLNGNASLVNDLDLLSDEAGCYIILNNYFSESNNGDSTLCENNNEYFFTKKNNPLRDSGNWTSTYTGALSFSFPSPLSLNLGWGLSINSPNDIRQSNTNIIVYSIKIGYKFFDNSLNVTLGGNYVIGYKDKNGFWDSGEKLISEVEDGIADQFDLGDTFIDKIELDNNKLTLKSNFQFKIPDQNLSIGLNFDYTQSTDNLITQQEDPTYKVKLAIKYGF